MTEVSRKTATIDEHQAEILMSRAGLVDSPRASFAKLEEETESAYIDRLTIDYASRAPNAPPALVTRATSFIRAMASRVFESPATEEMIASRIGTCLACDAFRVSLTEPDQLGHCAECGCGVSKRSSISEKSKILASTCPRKLWDVRVPPTV